MSLFKKPPPSTSETGAMTNDRLGALIGQIDPSANGQPGYWQFSLRGRDLLVITDETHNRMRIMAPIAPQDELEEDDFVILLQANFGRALDAKFALNDGVVWSVFIHPLAELTEGQFHDAVEQVATLADNYGTSYASSNLSFGGR